MMRTFSCPSCHAKFAWKDAYLNRKVSCKCGCVFEAFEDPPEERQVDPYDITIDEQRTPIPPASTVARPLSQPIGAPQGAQPLTPYPTRIIHTAQSEEGVDERSVLKNIILPGVLMAGAVGIILLQGALDPQPERTSAHTIALSAFFMAIMIVTMLAGGALSALLMGVEFGSPGRVAWKFAGIAMFAAAVGVVAAGLDPDPLAIRGKVIAWHIVMILYWIGFQFFFDLDVQENLMSVAIIGILQAIVACLLWNL